LVACPRFSDGRRNSLQPHDRRIKGPRCEWFWFNTESPFEPTDEVARSGIDNGGAGARQAFRSLVLERLTFTPKNEGGERFYVFEGMAVLDRFLAGIALPKALVAPTGFEPVFESRSRFRQRHSVLVQQHAPN
jgi:hypothetical protein